MRARLCQTIVGPTMADLLRARDAVGSVDMVELRLDGVPDVDVSAALADRRHPTVVTCRPTWEGGRFAGSEAERRMLLAQAIDLGAEFVDVEWQALHGPEGPAFEQLIARDGFRVLLSTHDFSGVPVDLEARVRDMRARAVGAIKIAVSVSRPTQLLPLRAIGSDGHAVVIGMGEAGIASRLLPSRFGSAWTYGGNAVAPGQLPAEQMLQDFRFNEVGPDTRLFGSVGPWGVSLTTATLHNAAFTHAGIDAVCVPLCSSDRRDIERFAEAMAMGGVSEASAGADDHLPSASGAAAFETLVAHQFERWVGTPMPTGVLASTLRRLQDVARGSSGLGR